MPSQARMFNLIDHSWGKIMTIANECRLVTKACEHEAIYNNLPDLEKNLNECQLKLENYLENKRRKFPRFYSLSDESLLKILAVGQGEPEKIQADIDNIFEGIDKIGYEVDPIKKVVMITHISSIMSKNMETVRLVNSVPMTGNVES